MKLDNIAMLQETRQIMDKGVYEKDDRTITRKTKSRKLTLVQNGICAVAVVASALIYHGVLVKIDGEVAGDA